MAALADMRNELETGYGHSVDAKESTQAAVIQLAAKDLREVELKIDFAAATSEWAMAA